MSRFAPIPVVGGSYADDTKPFTDQDTVGWIPTASEGEGTRSASYLRDPPGLREFAYLGTKHRGGCDVEGKAFVVSGTSLFQVYTSTGLSDYLGEIPGTGRVSFAHNQITNGNELLITTGSAGYIWNTATATLTRITDAGYPGAKFAEYMNHSFLQIEPQGRYAFTSDLDDGLNYNTTERFRGESKPDRIVGHVVANGEYQMFNERSMDHFDYVGVTGELLRNKNIQIDRGCAAGATIRLLDNGVFFVGDDGSGYEKRGYEFRRITTHAIETAWAKCKVSKAFAFTWEDRGHKVWYVTFPDGHTWGYDVATRLWHRRESYGMKRWRLATLFKSNGAWYGGEYNSGRLFRLDWDYALEGSAPLVRRRRMGVGHDNQNQMLLEALELVFDTGGPETVADGALPLTIYAVGNVPDGVTGTVIDQSYRAIGGQGPYSWEISSGTLAPGLSMDAMGHVTGTLTTEGNYSWTVRVTDFAGATDTLVDTCEVAAAIYITGAAPDSLEDVAYSYGYTRHLGTGPFAWTISSGALPTGVTINGTTGALSGTPTTPGTYSFTVQVVDSLMNVATLADVIEITAITVYSFNLNGITNAGTTSAVGYTLPHTFAPGETLTMWVTSDTYLAWHTNPAQPYLCAMQTTDPHNGTVAHFSATSAATAAAANALAVAAGPFTLTGITGTVICWLNDTPVVDNDGGLSLAYTIT